MQNINLIAEIAENFKVATQTGETPCFIFDRISANSSDSKSLEYQDAYSKRYVTLKNLNPVYHFSATESAWSSKDRKLFHTMIQLSEKFDIKNLVFKNYDRLSRNLSDLILIKSLIEEKDFTIHFYESHQTISKDSPRDEKFLLDFQILIAKRHSDKLSDDIKAANRYKIERKIAPGGAKLGYIYDKDKRIHLIDKAREAEIRWIFDEFDSGKHSLTEFVDLVNAKGIKNRQGRRWYKSGLHELLTNPFYHGEFYSLKEDQVYPGNHEPYYPKERYDKRVEMLQGRVFPRKNGNLKFRLSHLLKCDCGSYYYASQQKSTFIYYEHPCKFLAGKHKRFNEKLIFRRIDAEIENISLSDEFAKHLTAVFSGRIKERNSNNQADMLEITNGIMNLNRKKNKLFELFAEDGIDKADLMAKISEYDRQLAQLQKQAKVLAVDQKEFVVKVSEIIQDFREFPQIYAASTEDNKAELLKKSLRSIVVHDGRLELLFKDEFRILYKPELLRLAKTVQVHPNMWAHQDLNLGPTDYESAALTN